MSLSGSSGRTSFQKRPGSSSSSSSSLPSLPGTYPSLQAHQVLLTPSGVPALDAVLGGGISLGSVVLLQDDSVYEEDEVLINYTRLPLKYFLGEGVAQRHALFFGSCDHDAKEFLPNLPEVVEGGSNESATSKASQQKSSKDDENLKIAWRYKNQNPRAPMTSLTKDKGHSFDLQKAVSAERLGQCDCHVWTLDGLEEEKGGSDGYRKMAGKLRAMLAAPQFTLGPPAAPGQDPAAAKNLLRIGIQNVGSAAWTDDADDADAEDKNLCAFLLALRALTRNYLGVAVLTLSPGARSAASLARIHECCDHVISLKTFDKKTRSSGLFKEHHGFLEMVRGANLNLLQAPQFAGKYLFRSLRTKMAVERIHLPPEMAAVEAEQGGQKRAKPADIEF